MNAWSQLGLGLEPTPAMRDGRQRVFQCLACGTIVVVPDGRRPGRERPCSACSRALGWTEQQLPVAGLSVDPSVEVVA